MKHILPLLLFIPASSLPLFAADPQTGSGEKDGYRLVCQDLFDAEELNPDRWLIQINGGGGGNNELQFYMDAKENVRLGDDGQGNHCLILTARREDIYNRHFTSGRLSSKKRTAFTHGKVEASIKLPKTADGLWPAFWMMGNDYDKVGWPRCGEIDILEMGNSDGIRRNTQERFFNGATHWGPQGQHAQNAKSVTNPYSLQDVEFHLYTLIWDTEGLKMYVDLDKNPEAIPYYSIDCPADDPDNQWSPGNYFHKDHFILFNLAVGGDFTGIHDPAKITALNEENGQQASMYINYVKIYQKGTDSEHLTALTESDPMPGESGIYLTETTDTIRVNGNRIMSECGPLSLYSPAGRCVASAKSGELSTSDILPGFYLASDGTSTLKILVNR